MPAQEPGTGGANFTKRLNRKERKGRKGKFK
jgi:hypothetical protein